MSSETKVPSPETLERYRSSFQCFVNDIHVVAEAEREKPSYKGRDYAQAQTFRRMTLALENLAAGEPVIPRDRYGTPCGSSTINRFWIERPPLSGKDTDVAICILWLLMFSRKSLDIVIANNSTWTAKSPMVALRNIVELNEWIRNVGSMKVDGEGARNNATQSRCKPTWQPVHIWNLLYDRPDVVVINGLANMKPGDEQFAEHLMRAADLVGDNGIAIITTTAGYKGTWQERWRNGMLGDGGNGGRFAKCIPDPMKPMNWLPKQVVEQAKVRSSESEFRRLWMGEWVEKE